MKIYSNDPLVHYATTELSPERTQMQINGILAEYGVKKVAWNFDIPREVWVLFDVVETIEGTPIRVPVKVVCPTIWDPSRPRARDQRKNWNTSTGKSACESCTGLSKHIWKVNMPCKAPKLLHSSHSFKQRQTQL
jgi:hypothetical protein